MRKILQTAKPRDIIFVVALAATLIISSLCFRKLFNLLIFLACAAVLLYPVYLLIGAAIVMHRRKINK